MRSIVSHLNGLVASVIFLSLPCLSAEPTTASSPGVEQVVVVFKTHFDIGYTQLAREVVERYRTSMIDKALDVCDHTDKLPPENRFVWTLSGWPMTQILWPGQTPERRARIEKAIRGGRLVWHAIAGTTHTESMGMEDLVRSLGFSSRLARQFGQPLPRDAKMTDVPCHTWLLPTVLKRAGVDFLHLGCNSASGSPDIPALFWWEGPDGSRLLTMYTAEGYGTDLVPPKGWKHKTWLALIHTGDNHGPPTPQETEALFARAKRELPGVKIRLGRLSDFGDAILAEEKQSPTLPVVRKDMPDTWIHGLLSMPQEASITRQVRPQMQALESLNTLLGYWGVKVPAAASALATAYEGSFLYSEHTWGASSMYYSPRLYGQKWKEAYAVGKYKYADESFREHGDYIRKAQKATAPALAENVQALASAVGIAGRRIVAFNPLPWTRTATIEMRCDRGGEGWDWQDASTGARIPAVVDPRARKMRLSIDAIPALGYRTLVPAATAVRPPATAAAPQGATTIENAAFRVEADLGKGILRSLFDKRAGRDLVDRSSSYGFGQYLYERFDKDYHQKFLDAYCKKPLPGWADEFGRAGLPPASEFRYSAVSPTAVVSHFSGAFCLGREGSASFINLPNMLGTVPVAPPRTAPSHQTRLSVRLYPDQPCLDLEWSMQDKQPDPWPEAGWLCLPFAVEQPQFRLGRPGSVIDPSKDSAQSANFEIFCLDTGLTVTGSDGKGVGVCPMDTPLVSLGQPGGFRFTREWSPRKPTVFVNLFNTNWGTNFQQWIGGSWSSRVRIWSVDGKGAEADLITPSCEARASCQAAVFDGPAGKLPPTQGGIELSRKGVLVTAFGPNPDGEGILLRLWEQAGQDGVCKVKLPEALRGHKARLCDLRGQPIEGAVAMRDGCLQVPLTHFAPTSVLLEK
jgi:hypothetical protein